MPGFRQVKLLLCLLRVFIIIYFFRRCPLTLTFAFFPLTFIRCAFTLTFAILFITSFHYLSSIFLIFRAFPLPVFFALLLSFLYLIVFISYDLFGLCPFLLGMSMKARYRAKIIRSLNLCDSS